MLRQCWSVLSTFLILFFFVLLLVLPAHARDGDAPQNSGFAFAVFGSRLPAYRTFFQSFVTCFRFFFGDVSYDDLASADPSASGARRWPSAV